MGTFQQNDDGSWSPAVPIGWSEEHNLMQRLWFKIRRIEHCNDKERHEAHRKARP